MNEINKAGTANEILREVLGIPVTMATWVEEKLETIVDKYAEMDVTSDSIKLMKSELEEIGLSNMIPESIISVMERSRRDD